MTLQDFHDRHIGKHVDFDGHFGPQCKDLFSFYNRDVVGNPQYVPGDAWQLYEAAPLPFYRRVSAPEKGDVAVWKKALGGYGHVAIVWDKGLFLSQNYPTGAPVSVLAIPTHQLMGYLRPTRPMFEKYENCIIRHRTLNLYAYVKRVGDMQKKQEYNNSNGSLAITTFLDRLGSGVFPQEHIVTVEPNEWDAIPNIGPGEAFFPRMA